jgi:hypothetical protein
MATIAYTVGVFSMVIWTRNKYNAHCTRIIVIGVSSGGMITNLLISIGYTLVSFPPEVSWLAGAFGCFATKGNNTGV